MSAPKVVFLFSGKRKSGKDYVVSRLQQKLSSDVSTIITLSAPLKQQYAKEHGLDYERLLDASSYKEEHRMKMISWGEAIRAKDPGYFCALASEGVDKPVWLVSDCRRPTDIEYFKARYLSVTVRVSASVEVRKSRGWEFVGGVDDAPSECALDSYTCDCHVINNGEEEKLLKQLEKLREIARKEI